MKISATVKTDIGRRKINQDGYYLQVFGDGQQRGVFAVLCDGAGGLSHAEQASKMAVEGFAHWFQQNRTRLLLRKLSPDEVFSEWKELLAQINSQIFQFGKNSGFQLGTTIAVFFAIDGFYYAMNVGDSRIYALGQDVRRLSRDHTLVQWEVEQRQLDPEQAKTDKRRNILLRCVGAAEDIEADYFCGALSPGSRYLICSDGFYHEISEQELHAAVARPQSFDSASLSRVLETLFSAIQQRGERDNVTAVLIGIQEMEDDSTIELHQAVETYMERAFFAGNRNNRSEEYFQL